MMRPLRSSAFLILFLSSFSASAQSQSADQEILSLAEKLLGQAKSHYEKKEWFEAMELAERARTACLALSELYASQSRTADLRRLNESVTQCNQLVRLARDARKAELEKAAVAPGVDTKKPDTSPPAKAPAPLPDPVTKVPERPMPPEVDVQEKAAKSIREVFKAEYAKTSIADRQALAQKLLKEAVATKGDRAFQFVLFRQASDMAAQVGDLATAFGAIDAVEAEFTVDALALKVATLSKVPTATTHELAGPAVEACLKVVGEGVRRDHYELAAIVLKKAEALTRNPINVTLQARVQARAREVAELRKGRENLKIAEKTLSDKPDDPDANLLMGRFLCLMKGDWDRGVPMLRKGTDVALRKIAETEAANPAGAEVLIADAWLALVEKEGDSVAKTNLKVHARAWYQRALPELTGFPKTRVEKVLRDMAYEGDSKWSVDLLKLIDLKKDSVWGTWTEKEGTLVSDLADCGRVQIPYSPPEEYDMTVVASCRGQNDALCIGLLGGGRQFLAVLDGYSQGVSGLEFIDGKNGLDNETAFRGGRVFPDGNRHTALFSVRKSGVRVAVDGRLLFEWKGDYRRTALATWWNTPSKKTLSIGSFKTSYEISEIWLTPISGQGQKLR